MSTPPKPSPDAATDRPSTPATPSIPATSTAGWGWFLLLGTLLGIFEATAIVRYDWLMDDWAPGRVLAAVPPLLAIVAVNVGGWSLLALLGRRRPLVVVTLGAALITVGRMVQADRFERWTVGLALAAVATSALARRMPRISAAVIALFVGIVALWGRVPSSGLAMDARVLMLVPGVVLVGVVAMGAARLTRRPTRGVMTAAVVLFAVGLLPMLSSRAAPATRPPSLLFVLVDTLRTDHVAPYGERATPSTARLAAEGLTFDNAITVIPKTTQSVAAFQTGRYPVNNGVRALKDALPDAQTTLAEHLSAQGFRTGAVVHNPWVRRGRGFEQGFGQFWSFYEVERAWGTLRYTGLVTALDTFTVRAIRSFDPNTDAATATDRALAFLDETPDDQPFYLYVHYFDPHWPYRPPGEDAENRVNNIHHTRWSKGELVFRNPLRDDENAQAIRLYGKEVDHNADQVGRLLQWLDDNGRADDTIVVFTADHGHHLGDHDYWYHHGAFLYEPGLKIPLLVRAPGDVAPSTVESGQFRSIDLLPTLLGWMDQPAMPALDGIPLDKLHDNGAPAAFLESDQVFFKANRRRPLRGALGKVRGIRDGRWKLHLTPTRAGGRWELYDLDTDPDELTNLIAAPPTGLDLPALVAELARHIPDDERAELEARGHHFDRAPSGVIDAGPQGDAEPEPSADPGISEQEAEMLRAMGYMD